MIRKNKRLKIAMIERDMTQKEVAAKAIISERDFSLIVNGRLVATTEEKEKISRVLNKPVEDLFPI